MSRDLVEEGLGWSWRPERVSEHLARRDTLGVVARGASPPLRGFGLMRYADDEAHLLLLAVAPEARRLGLGRRILAWLEVCAREADLDRIVLEVRAENQGARAFYLAEGFEARRLLRGYYARPHRREDAVRMVKRLRRGGA